MKSITLTKINKVTLDREEQLQQCSGPGDMKFLKAFIKSCHKAARIKKLDANTYEVFTKRFTYRYSCFADLIRKIDLDTETKTFYKIS
jgi:hypothetical protein